MALRVQLVILASAFEAGSTLWRVSCCPTCPAICKSGDTPPCPVVPDPLSGARPLGDGVGSGDLRDGSPSVWCRGKSLVWSLVPPRFQLFVKMGARAPVPYGVGATVSDILIIIIIIIIIINIFNVA